MWKSTTRTSGAALLALAFVMAGGWGTAAAQATGSVNVAWDPIDTNVITDLMGYRAYASSDPNVFTLTPAQARAAGAQTANLGVGTTTHTFTGLNANLLWTFAVTAIDTSGNESVFSNTDSMQPNLTPTVRTVSPSTAVQGTSIPNITISGDNFQSGATVDIGPDVALGAVDSTGAPSTLKVPATVSPLAQLKSFDVTVTNPGGSFGKKVGGFTVTLDIKRLDIDKSGRVDNGDFADLLLGFPSFVGDSLYSTTRDIDVDGDVDGVDLAILLSFFGINP